ncbi:MAG: KTSC domain-containing protein [Acidobacteria bacterium]|nr:KTSC domain-containing protein [Acidobacteriota bacterium]MBV9477752.1 KTSC domain-containing protein [Acidobacteriota bacterium]
MESQLVDSSVLLSVGYDAERSVLKVRFRNGRLYFYLDVPRAVYERLMAAPSIGKYLNETIKPTYRAVRVRE